MNQISAGEVVERPASVVKELVENSLDAGATRISIDLIDAGRTLIRVSDNGMGMSPEDAVASMGRHATSKIALVEDLLAVKTLGFRGEALPSIASVSRFVLSTRSTGYEARSVLRIDGGDWLGAGDGGDLTIPGKDGLPISGGQAGQLEMESGPPGTTITVEDLFFNTPVRLKFLKKDTTELGVSLDVVSRLAVAYPHVAFRLTHNGQVGLETIGDGNPLEALAQVWSRDLARALVEVDVTVRGIRLRGFVSPPHVTKPNRSYQFLSVNGRFVRSRSLTAALDVAYRELTPERRFCVVCLSLEVDPARLDVNVSPTKTEVRFEHDGDAFEALRVGIRSALLEHGMMPSAAGIAQANEALRSLETPRPLFDPRFGGSGYGAAGLPASGFGSLADRIDGVGSGSGNAPDPAYGSGSVSEGKGTYNEEGSWIGAGRVFGDAGVADSGSADAGEVNQEIGGVTPEPAPDSLAQGFGSPHTGITGLVSALDESRFPFAALLDGLRIVGQAMNTFIIAETNRGLILVDQHVAHERVLYEWLCGLKGGGYVERQPLLVPQTIQLDRREALLLQGRLGELSAVGFELEEFGGGTFVIRSAPAALSMMTGKRQDPVKVLRNLIEELVEGETTGRIVTTREQIWITASCKMAVKAGDPLSHAEMEKLLMDLATTENPYLCPHGRPITATLTNADLLRLFKRS